MERELSMAQTELASSKYAMEESDKKAIMYEETKSFLEKRYMVSKGYQHYSIIQSITWTCPPRVLFCIRMYANLVEITLLLDVDLYKALILPMIDYK